MKTLSSLQWIDRPLQTESDWLRVRDFILHTERLTGPRHNWEIRHWDGNRYHRDNLSIDQPAFHEVHLWMTPDDELAAFLVPEGACMEVNIHPDFRDQVEPLVFAYAEACHAQPDAQGGSYLETTVYEYDVPRKCLLAARGYEKQTGGWVCRRMLLRPRVAVAVPVVAEGYQLRSTANTWEDAEKMALLLNAGFGRVDVHQPQDSWNFFHYSPTFSHDLNLVMVAPDGSFAAHAGLTIDPANGIAIFEPVCTHPDHRRKGLAQALMFEGLHRLKARGVREVEVCTGDAAAANALYTSIGFTQAYKAYSWKKVWA